jgi:nucleoside-diphosphate-sugar epimerase
MPPLFLVTGPDGWLGSRLVSSLREAHPGSEVRGLAGDLRQPGDLDRFVAGAKGAVLFHTAAVIHPHRVREFYDVNVRGTHNVIAAAQRAGVRRLVAVSSNSAFGVNPSRGHRFDESSPYHPYMNYGRSKMEMELAVRQAAGIETVIVRTPWFYGPGQPRRQTVFFKMIRDGKAPIVGDGNSPRSMAYVDNLVLGLRLAADKARHGSVYWIADEHAYTMNEIVDTVEDLFEKDFNVRCAHRRMRLPDAVSAVALLADRAIQGAGLYNSKIHVLSEMNKTIACSVARAQAELGYQPPVALREGMRRSLKWCFEAGHLP